MEESEDDCSHLYDVESDASEEFGGDNFVQALKHARGDLERHSLAEFSNEVDAESYVHASTPYEFGHDHNSTYKPTAFKRKVFICLSHDDCVYRMQITTKNQRVFVESTGLHTANMSVKAIRGVAKRLKVEVDGSLCGGYGPMKLYKKLMVKYASDAVVTSRVPTPAQLKNRKQYLRANRSATGGVPWRIDNLVHLQEWACDHRCADPKTFFGSMGSFDPDTDFDNFQKTSVDYQDELLVIDCFSHDVKLDNGALASSFGVVFTSRRVLRNAVGAILGQGDQVLAVSDGTYKICFNGWTLTSVGSCGVHRERSVYARRYHPWASMFVRTESKEAYTTLFSTVERVVADYFNLKLSVAFGSLDHAPAIAAAFRTVWPSIRLLSCWPHFVRAAFTKSNEMGCQDVYDAMVKSNLEALHSARSASQFRAIAELFIKHWGNEGYVKWVSEQYLQEPWNMWFANCSECPGVMPNQNPIESYHRAMKQTSAETLRATTTVVLNSTLPLILVQTEELSIQRHFCEGPVPSEMVMVAQALKSQGNHRLVKSPTGSKETISVLFNSRVHLCGVGGLQELAVDKKRAAVFLLSLHGQLKRDEAPENVPINYLSLHQVMLLDASVKIQHRIEDPMWTIHDITAVRSKYRCDCKAHFSTGWVCSHVIATLALIEENVDLTRLLQGLPAKRLPGRPLKVAGALTKVDGGYGADKLRQLFLTKPGYPVNWNVLKEFPQRRNPGVIENVAGKVKPFTNKDGVYFWKIVFENAKIVSVGCEELIEIVTYTRKSGFPLYPPS